MFYFLTSRQPLFLIVSVLGLSAASLHPASNLKIERAFAESSLAVGDQVTSLAELTTLPDGPHQLCSEPEPTQYQGAGICYWFTKTGDHLIGYYGIPHSGVFVDCVRGEIKDDKIIGDAIAISWDGAPFGNAEKKQPITWRTLTLGPGKVEYTTSDGHGDMSLIKFNQAELTLRDFYRYSPAKVKQMNDPPTTCNVQDWVNQIASL